MSQLIRVQRRLGYQSWCIVQSGEGRKEGCEPRLIPVMNELLFDVLEVRHSLI